MQRRARSTDDKRQRTEDLIEAAAALASSCGGVRHVTLNAVSRRAGLDPSGVRRYFANREELFLELAERGWETLNALPLFCDLLTHVPLSLEGGVSIARARSYKARSFAAHDEIVGALTRSSDLEAVAAAQLITAAIALAAYLWQLAHPTDMLRQLYREEPRWEHAALDFEPRLVRLLAATASGLRGTSGRLTRVR
jgi:AcrR family transcriptional regulator